MTFPHSVLARVALKAVRCDADGSLQIREWVLWEMEDHFTIPGNWAPKVHKEGGEPLYPWCRSRVGAVMAFVQRREADQLDLIGRAQRLKEDVAGALILLDADEQRFLRSRLSMPKYRYEFVCNECGNSQLVERMFPRSCHRKGCNGTMVLQLGEG